MTTAQPDPAKRISIEQPAGRHHPVEIVGGEDAIRMAQDRAVYFCPHRAEALAVIQLAAQVLDIAVVVEQQAVAVGQALLDHPLHLVGPAGRHGVVPEGPFVAMVVLPGGGEKIPAAVTPQPGIGPGVPPRCSGFHKPARNVARARRMGQRNGRGNTEIDTTIFAVGRYVASGRVGHRGLPESLGP